MNHRSRCTVGEASAPPWPVILIAAAIALLPVGCGRHEPAAPQGPAVKVQTLEIQLQRAPDVYEAVGTVRAKLTATVSPRVMATIQQIPVKAGDFVRAGDELARLDDRDLRAEYVRAQADYDRFKNLLEKEAATRAEFDAVQSRYRTAEANLSYADITAPFDGVVGQKLCDVGDLASPGKPLFVVEQPSDFRLETQVPERFAGVIGAGKPVHVVIDATGEKCDGTIGEVDPAGDPASHTFVVKIDLRCQQALKSGQFGRAELFVGERTGLFVPRGAIHERGQLTYVLVAADGAARMRLVKPGGGYADLVELLSGVQVGDRVIVKAEGELSDGQQISALP
ncbi:MAG TPA: efflux RND transporter periplasmic adaptor subunit [Verrucomicrobiae bacterium]|nr:efflux RND transporter periplasmic adaptor subunit [Verrucomicrobiae bacterium]